VGREWLKRQPIKCPEEEEEDGGPDRNACHEKESRKIASNESISGLKNSILANLELFSERLDLASIDSFLLVIWCSFFFFFFCFCQNIAFPVSANL
jgi:hypothetical protein